MEQGKIKNIEQTKYDVFISYSWDDIDIAKKIYAALNNAGLKCCFDKETFHGGADFPKITAENICNSDVFLYLGSKNSFTSGWAPDEVAFAKSHKSRGKLLYYAIDKNTMPDWMDLSFAAINRRNIFEHSFNSVLIDDIRKMMNESDVNICNNDTIENNWTVSDTGEGRITIKGKGCSYDLIYVDGGTFLMGAQGKDPDEPNYDTDAERNEGPVHNVTLDAFYIGETPVTQSLWRAVMGNNPSSPQGDFFPVVKVSIDDCREFARRLGKLTGTSFFLPTEAEWEYAARGGNISHGFKYAGSNSIDDVAWYRDNCDDKVHPVKGKSPNELGLFDMCGSVCEWCEDKFGHYSDSNQTNPSGPISGQAFVFRGGSRNDSAKKCRVTFRDFSPGNSDRYIGFRIVHKKKVIEEVKRFLVGEVVFNMVYVQGGSFQMGVQNLNPELPNYNEDAWSDEGPVHNVTLDDYYIGETLVTQALWKSVMKTEPTYGGGWIEERGRGDNYPVYWVSWDDCQEFICKLNTITGKHFRLPTEAEWEYAARGGVKKMDNRYAGGNTIDDVAWYIKNSNEMAHPVKEKLPNELGIFDMSGNVWEWCMDSFSQEFYNVSPSDNPICKIVDSDLVLRGGSWDDEPRGCRVAVRGNGSSNRPYKNHGLRLVLV